MTDLGRVEPFELSHDEDLSFLVVEIIEDRLEERDGLALRGRRLGVDPFGGDGVDLGITVAGDESWTRPGT